MSEALRCEDEVGKVFIQVQDDLRQLKHTISGGGDTLDIQALDTAICRTESVIKKRAEEYLKTVNKQLLILPCIEDLQKKSLPIPKWKPILESFPAISHQTVDPARPSPGEKHKAAFVMRLLCNPGHPKNRALMQEKFGIPLPDVHRRSVNAVPHHRITTGATVSNNSISAVSGACRHLLYPTKAEEEDDARADMSSLLETDCPSSAVDVCLLQTLIKHKSASLHRREELCSSKMGLTGGRSRCHKRLTWGKEPGPTRESRECTPTWTANAPTPPPSAASKSSGHANVKQDAKRFTLENPQDVSALVPVAKSELPFVIAKGRIDPSAADFGRFRRHYQACWSSMIDPLETLEKLLREYAVPVARVSGERLAAFGRGSDTTGPGRWRRRTPLATTPPDLLAVLENGEEVLDLVRQPGRRYKGEGGVEAAAVRIQSCWRRCAARAAFARHRRRKWAAATIGAAWRTRARLRRVREALQARRFRQLENHRSRVQHLATNWKHIQSSKRTIIHIPSLGYSQSQRLKLRGFDILQNIQICRLCEVRDENVEVIYVSPRPLGEDVRRYYANLLKHGGGTTAAVGDETAQRFIILTPDAVEWFPNHNACHVSTLLKYSPRTLRRIGNLIRGKRAYIIGGGGGGAAHADELAVADELGVPVLGAEPAVARLYGTKSGGRRIFAGAGVPVPPGQGDIYTLNQLHETLARLMTQNMEVRRWLFKTDSESGGTAYCDARHLACHGWATREFRRHGPELWSTAWAQEPVLLKYLDEVPEWLARHAKPAKTSRYPDWACFLKTFLRQGGVVEAFPPSDSVTRLTVDMLLEPGGEVTLLSCGDQLHRHHRGCSSTTATTTGLQQLETALGSVVPQTSVCPDALRSVCARVGRACLQRLLVGHVSLGLATFLDHRTLEQKVWTIDLDLRYSDQLAMTQMLLFMTGGTLDCSTGRLEVPVPMKEKSAHHRTAKSVATNRYAVIGSCLLHTNLSMVHYNVFFSMCKAHGIGFDLKERQGTVFALHDSSERYSLGMVTVSEDLQGALVTFARNLSIIHQEISFPKMQGETNFKDLIKNIEDELRKTMQNKVQGLEAVS